MECELCMDAYASSFQQTDWGFRHVCATCAPDIELTDERERRPDLSYEDRFNTAAERFLSSLGLLPEDQKRPPHKPK